MEPLHPIFDGIISIHACALFAIAIGCDILPEGILRFASAATADIKSVITWMGDPSNEEQQLLGELVIASVALSKGTKKFRPKNMHNHTIAEKTLPTVIKRRISLQIKTCK